MKIYAVTEIEESDPANTFLMDVDLLDPANETCAAYRKAIETAVVSGVDCAGTDNDCCLSYGDHPELEAAVVKPPCQVEGTVILYIE